ncbi:hypothetical protein FOCC_FOCC000892 [Frankliniella occidentalis]|nr:hypothetical protein FOCC_FOCC000892 [Frankliniella occidentalis]
MHRVHIKRNAKLFIVEGYHQISHGEKLKDVAHECWSRNSHQLVAIGVNCLNPKYVTSLLSDVNEEGRPHIPLIVYPNSGEVYSPKTGWTDPDNVPSVDSYVEEWLSLGVEYVGGCCRTNAKDISRMRAHVDRWLKEGTFTGPMEFEKKLLLSEFKVFQNDDEVNVTRP